MTKTNELIKTLIRPNIGEFALGVYQGLQNGEISFSKLMVTLFRLSICSYVGKKDEEFDNVGDDDCWRYSDVGMLCDEGGIFTIICLEKMIADGKASKEGTLVTLVNEEVDISVLKEKFIGIAEAFGDEDTLSDWLNWIDRFLKLAFNSNRLCFSLLDNINPTNSDVVFSLCIELKEVDSMEKLRKMQRFFPEDFHQADEIIECHARRIFTQYCYFFLEQSSWEESAIMNEAEKRAEKAKSLSDQIIARSTMDVYLFMNLTFPYTLYRIITEHYEPQLKEKPTLESVFNGHDIPDELQNVFKAAKEGDATAQSELASRYLSGTGLPKDEYKAVLFLQLAAEGGDAIAQTNYGVAFQKGIGGLKQSYSEAIEWFLKAAEKGEEAAMYNLGWAYGRGLGVERNIEEKNRWMKLSADKGYFMAELVLEADL